VPTDIDRPSGHDRPGVRGRTERLVPAAHRGHGQHPDHRVQQPASAPTPQVPAGLHHHPDHESQQGGRPHPAEYRVYGGTERQQEQTAQSHERGGNRSPSLRLVGVPHRQHGQHCPPQREPAQDRTGNGGLLIGYERGGDQEQRGEESGRQRPGHDPTNVAPRRGMRARRTVLGHVHRGRGGRCWGSSHDGLDSMHTWQCQYRLHLWQFGS